MKPIETLLEKALDRKSRRLTYKTTYSHDNLYAWLKTILPTWEIFIPQQEVKGSSAPLSFPALSDWPSINIRDTVKHWIEEQNASRDPHAAASRDPPAAASWDPHAAANSNSTELSSTPIFFILLVKRTLLLKFIYL